MITPSSSTYCSTRSICTTPANSGGANSCQRLANPGNTYCGIGTRAAWPPYTWLLLLLLLNVVNDANSNSNDSTFPNLSVFAFSTNLANDVKPVQLAVASLSAITSSSKNICLAMRINGGFFAPN